MPVLLPDRSWVSDDGRWRFSGGRWAPVPPALEAAGIPATASLVIGPITINNLGLGALSAIVLWQILRPSHVAEFGREEFATVAPEERRP